MKVDKKLPAKLSDPHQGLCPLSLPMTLLPHPCYRPWSAPLANPGSVIGSRYSDNNDTDDDDDEQASTHQISYHPRHQLQTQSVAARQD